MDNNEQLAVEYEQSFDTNDKLQHLLKLTSDAYTREIKRINVSDIGVSEPVKRSRVMSMIGLTGIVKDLGVLQPIDVMTSEDGDGYILISGLRRLYGAMKNGIKEIDAIVWDFEDKERGSELALYLGLILNKHQKRTYSEIWHLYQILELQSPITPSTLEYLLEMDSGDAMKLKDVMTSGYTDEVVSPLVEGEKTLEQAYKQLCKLRKEEDKLAIEDSIGVSDTVEGADEIASEVNSQAQLTDQDVMELLDMADSTDLESIDSEDFSDLNQGVDEGQRVGDRHPLDPALKSAVLQRDNFRCQCCGFGGGALLGALAVHHIIPVHCSGKDTMNNLVTLCVNHHLVLHIAERNGGKLHITEEEFNAYPEQEQRAMKKCLKYAKIAVEAGKRQNLSSDAVRKATESSLKHPMPGAGLKEVEQAYRESQLKEKEG